MPWNWEQPDWPQLTWNAARIARAEDAFLVGAGVFMGTVSHLSDDDRIDIAVRALASEAVQSSAIEGEVLDRSSVQSSIRRELGIAGDSKRASPAEQGMSRMMVDVYRRFDAPLDEDTLHAWHRLVMQGAARVRDVGRYRTHAEPMQIVSGRIAAPRVHFEAPPSPRVPREMQRFIAWFNDTAPTGCAPLPAVTRAALAHLHFVSVHPYEDGNGRLARAISEKALAWNIGRTTFTAIAATMQLRRAAYYEALAAANKGTEVTRWIAWFAGIALEAQARTLAEVEFVLAKARFLDRLRGQMNERQDKAILRMLREGADGFAGGMSASKYVSITRAASATATRDLSQLVEMRALQRLGAKRATRYYLDIPMRRVPRFEIDAHGAIRET